MRSCAPDTQRTTSSSTSTTATPIAMRRIRRPRAGLVSMPRKLSISWSGAGWSTSGPFGRLDLVGRDRGGLLREVGYLDLGGHVGHRGARQRRRLPAAAQRLVELDERGGTIGTRLSEAVLAGEQG